MRRRPPNDLLLWLDLLDGIVAGVKRYPVVASAVAGALVGFVIFGLIR